MLIPYTWLKEFINLKVPAEKAAEKLSLAAIGVEEVRKEGKEQILNLEVTYNRGDLLSVIGVARELAALYRLKPPKEEEEFKASSELERLTVKADEKLSPFYTLTLIQDLSYQETPEKIKRYLELAGMRSINLLADLTNYVMLEYGQPLHVFDAEKVRGRNKSMSIEVRSAKRGERIKTLDGSTHVLETSDIVIADKKGPIAIAGVMGGQETEVDLNTKEILLEAAIFDPIAIRKTARRLGLQSEASTRFEHHLSPENLLQSLNRATKLYQLYGKGRVTGFGRSGLAKTEKKTVNLSERKLNSLLGTEISISEAREYLQRLGFKVMSSEKGLLSWAPHFRGDINFEEDLIEEVARLYGYEKLSAIPPATGSIDIPPNNFEYLRNRLSCLLAGMGFTEVRTYPFLSSEALVHQNTEELLKLRNPISAEAEYLKDSSLLNLLEIVRKNAPRYKEGKIFELEKVYPREGEYFALAAALWGRSETYLALKGALETLLLKSHVDFDFAPARSTLLHPRQAAKIAVDRTEIGVIGEVHPHLAQSYGLEKIAFFELNLEKLAEHAKRWGSYTPIPPYPEVYEDFSFFLPLKKRLGPLAKKIETLEEIIRKVELVDLFEKKGERSITLRVTFQSDAEELSSQEIKPLREGIIKSIKKSGGKLRD